MWPSAVEFLVCGYGCMSAFENVLTDALPPSCLLKIYLKLKQAGHGAQERLFTQRGGNRTQVRRAAPVVAIGTASILHFPRTSKNSSIFFYSTNSHLSQKRS